MTTDDRRFIAALCSCIQAEFPGVRARYKNFKSATLGGERDGFLIIEVFDVPDALYEPLTTFAAARAYGRLQRGGGFVTARPWTPDETRKYFPDET